MQCTRPPPLCSLPSFTFFRISLSHCLSSFLSLSCCSFQLMHTKLVRWQNGRGQHCAALAAFMAYSELIALSFSHFILSVSVLYPVGLYTVLLLLRPPSHTFRANLALVIGLGCARQVKRFSASKRQQKHRSYYSWQESYGSFKDF